MNEITDIAAALFRQKGYDVATLEEVAEAIGVRKAALYRYVSGKENLLFVVVETALRRLAEANVQWRDAEGTALDQIHSFLRGHLAALIDNLDYMSVFYEDAWVLAGDERAAVNALDRGYHRQLEDLVRRAIADGLIDPSADPVIATDGLFGIVSYVYRWYRPGHGISRARLVAELPKMALCSLGTGSAPEARGEEQAGHEVSASLENSSN